MGGYFILNGLERVVRLLILPKRNYPMSMVRNSFSDRREGYTDKAVVIRCERKNQSSVSVKLYYLRNGSARLGFWIQGREYLLPVGVVLKALVDTTDHEIYVSLTCCYSERDEMEKGAVGTQLMGERAKIILDEVRDLSLFTRLQCLEHIGEHFQPVMEGLETKSYSDVADSVLEDYIFVHLDNNYDKFNLLIFMLQKLFSLIDQTSVPDNSDSLQNQEVLLPGHLITIYLKEKLEDWLRKAKKSLQDEINKKSNINNKGSNSKSKSFDFCSLADVKKILDKNPVKQISSSVENLLKTGRLITQTGLDLQQRAGFTVQAERLNFLRFISHFRAVHRGASFAGLRTTTVRKLLPESWGFLCPVHTPDGEPCGLLNHMTSNCRITSFFDSQGNIRDFKKIRKTILSVLIAVGMTPSLPKLVQAGPPEVLSVLLDGRVVGSLPSSMVEKVVGHLRRLKVSANSMIANDLEVGYVPLSLGGAYPGLYLFTSPARFVRPVRNISIPSEESQNIELIGPFEQVFMEIRCPDGGDGGRRNAFPATHEEIHPTGMLSVVANLTPWSDHNQSPRNMYQCQMAKQTMAFSSQAINFRADQKLYHLQTPQSPIVRTSSYTKYGIDEYPSGTNAIVAVLAYTGYDMEDAMILNKSSVERGMCRGQIYQTETIDLTEQSSRSDHSQKIFRRSNVNKSMHSTIDSDGLPYVGQTIQQNQPYYCTYDEVTSTTRPYNRKGSEPVVVDYVALDGKNKEHPRKTIQQNQPYYCTYDEVTSTTRPYNRKGSEPVVVDYVALDGKNKEHPRKTETIDLTEQSSRSDHSQKIFRRSNVNKSMHSTIDSDGLPYVGQVDQQSENFQTIQQNQPYYCTYDEVTSTTRPYNRKGSEPVVVDYVALDGKNKEHPRKANIRFRHPRNPVIGDKFSSRHGQKGVCSQLWPDIDMPFSGVTGMRPDLIINPHAFPSRMTIAMLLESVAAKGGSLHGYFVDATPFTIPVKKDNGDSKPKTSSLEETDGKTESKPNSLVEELGEMLKKKGFNYHGVEVLYSGVYGTELTCEIFIGPVYYQRLRHMVSDKYQVRSTGTIDQVTRQPIKGRKRGGGIRFGEMERDSMLAHGAAYLLHDRLHTCSDYHIADVCTLCGSILATTSIQQQKQIQKPKKFGGLPPARPPKKVICHACQSSKGMETVAMPYVFRYLAAELAAMNIKMTLQLSNAAGA
nr:dna-directed rna polymerase i subunit 2 [Quercus suber]